MIITKETWQNILNNDGGTLVVDTGRTSWKGTTSELSIDISIQLAEHDHGYYIGGRTFIEMQVRDAEVRNPEAFNGKLQSFIEDNMLGVIDTSLVGVWKEGDHWVLDVVNWVDNLETACKLAEGRNERALWAIAEGCEIWM